MSTITEAAIESAGPDAARELLSRPQGEQRVILRDISWATYERLLADLADQSHVRLAYDEGTLEIMSPLFDHEYYNRAISDLGRVISLELEINLTNAGSTTFKRKKLKRGAEPDTCFYIQHEARVRGIKKRVDLRVDPPPDVVFEVDLTSGSLDKFPIYGGFGVPEIWRYDGERLRIYHLEGKSYVEREGSRAFPWLTAAALTDFLEQTKTLGQTAALRSFRDWLRARRTNQSHSDSGE